MAAKKGACNHHPARSRARLTALAAHGASGISGRLGITRPRIPSESPLEWVEGRSFWSGSELGVPIGAATLALYEGPLVRRSKR